MTYIPSFDNFFNPVIQALKQLGESGSIEEIDTTVAETMKLTNEQLEVLHNSAKSPQTEVQYRIAWSRTYLKKYGLLENSNRGIWTLTEKGRITEHVDPKEVKKYVVESLKQKPGTDMSIENVNSDSESLSWQQEVLESLLKMDPSAFERLAQRLLRESGFIHVEVLGKSGDGGIDGKGIMRLGGLLSFHVYFQCKRYRGAVSSVQVRDFRGAMAGRSDKGLLITTGGFTRDAIKEATREGAQPIDLIDGNLLAEKLKELGLGIETHEITEERVIVNHEWFKSV